MARCYEPSPPLELVHGPSSSGERGERTRPRSAQTKDDRQRWWALQQEKVHRQRKECVEHVSDALAGAKIYFQGYMQWQDSDWHLKQQIVAHGGMAEWVSDSCEARRRMPERRYRVLFDQTMDSLRFRHYFPLQEQTDNDNNIREASSIEKAKREGEEYALDKKEDNSTNEGGKGGYLGLSTASPSPEPLLPSAVMDQIASYRSNRRRRDDTKNTLTNGSKRRKSNSGALIGPQNREGDVSQLLARIQRQWTVRVKGENENRQIPVGQTRAHQAMQVKERKHKLWPHPDRS